MTIPSPRSPLHSRNKAFHMPVPVDEEALALEAQVKALVLDIHMQLGHDATHPPALLTEDEAASILHQKPRTLRAWRYARSKELKWRKIGGTTLYRAYDLAVFILNDTQSGVR